MRVHSFITLFSLAASAFAYHGSGIPPLSEIENRDLSGERLTRTTPIEAPKKALSNAELMARGLPPHPPRTFHSRVVPGHAARRVLPLEAPGVARRAQGSPTPPLTKKGVIVVKNADNAQILGYVSKTWSSNCLYTVTNNVNNAIQVTINTASTAGVPIDVAVPPGQGNVNFPFAGGVVGFASVSSDLAPGSPSYVYVAGTNQTPPDSPPASVGNSVTAVTGVPKDSESAIWKYTSATQELTVQWVNSNGAKPATYSFFNPQVDYLGFTGDTAAFKAAFQEELTLVRYFFQEV